MGLKGGSITEGTTKDKKDIQHVLDYWHDDILDDTNLPQRTLLGPFKKKDGFYKDGWRLDSQSNGPFVKFPNEDPDTKYQNFAVQWQKSCVVAPLGQNPRPANALIIEAYNNSQKELKVAVIWKHLGDSDGKVISHVCTILLCLLSFICNSLLCQLFDSIATKNLLHSWLRQGDSNRDELDGRRRMI
ncbi:uncharacterized protein LOC9637760 [Selaginella moellendorffii]|uniref:uncharacterized protein LOC9637760 n=1 Tax=Selaginella moellendorffii TaxID=88036 RepID=UPI000D1C796C|nr:uncharacterized protein LOC9637760 [Selaginella moellendorffii]|eukprot:XP_024533926.1 uncharacterized protein LOC9637760 [Selaginella moellendorffii]